MKTFTLTDLSCALPTSAWTEADSHIHKPISTPSAGGWRIVDYQVKDFSGRALQTTIKNSEKLTIPLNLTGWYAIYLGMAGHYDQDVLDVRLTGGRWDIVRVGHGDIQEVPWRFTQLDGLSLQLRYPKRLYRLAGRFRQQNLTARLFYLRFQPVNKKHLAIVSHQRHKYPLVYINDGHEVFYHSKKAEIKVMTRSIQTFQKTDWNGCCFCNGGADLVNYPSKVGTLFGEGAWDTMRPNDQRINAILKNMINKKIDPLQVAIDQAHQQKHPFWFYIRPQAWVGEPPFDHAFRSRFFVEHPEYRCQNKKGEFWGKMSIAFPEVRKQLNTILQEGLDRGADGVGIALVRSCPLVYYEKPVMDRYRKLYDHRGTLDNVIPKQIRQIWIEFLRQWLQEIRLLLDKAGPSSLKKRRELVLITGPDIKWHKQFGINLKPLAMEGLVDVIMPYPLGNEQKGTVDVQGFVQLLTKTPVKIMPSLGSFMDHELSTQAVRQRAHHYYQSGAHGLSRWDAPGAMAFMGLNDPELIRLWLKHYPPNKEKALTSFVGLNMQCFPPLDGF